MLNQAIHGAAKRTRVVLEAPPLLHSMEDYKAWLRNASVEERNLSMRQLTWVWEMCQIDNIWMATSQEIQAFSSTPVNVDYSLTRPILGNIAASVINAESQKKTRDICSLIRQFSDKSKPMRIEQYKPVFNQIAQLSSTPVLQDIQIINPKFYENPSYLKELNLRQWMPSKTINSKIGVRY